MRSKRVESGLAELLNHLEFDWGSSLPELCLFALHPLQHVLLKHMLRCMHILGLAVEVVVVWTVLKDCAAHFAQVSHGARLVGFQACFAFVTAQ